MTRSNLIGGEMLNWSDLRPGDARPAAAGPAAAALLAASLTADDAVLLAGPHAVELVSAVASQVASADLLVRSAPDAEELAELLDGVKGQVFCGSVDRFAAAEGESYDVIVALDGLERLVGPDTANFPWADALDRLRGRLRPGGRLLLGATNTFGFDRLIQPDITAALPRDEDWARDTADRAPAGLKPLLTALQAAGFNTAEPTGVARTPVIAEDAGTTWVAGTTADAAQVWGRAYAVFPSLVRAEVAVSSVEGFAAVVAARAVAACNEGPVLMDPYRVVLDAAAAELAFELAPAWYFLVGAEGPAVLPEGVVPAGEGVLLEEHLLLALRADDQAELRRVIPGYVAWLGAGGAGSPDNVIFDGSTYRLFGEPQELDVVEHLRRFAQRTLEGGSRQPWPAAADSHALTGRLAAMAGITVPEQEFSPEEVIRPRGSAEQLATVARLADELAHASARAILFEGTVSGIRRSRPYRVGHAVMNPARVIRRRLERVLRKVRRR
ncbi:class I SAM-dependent methyltransferase [Kribbella sp. NPDC003557]|uniref:class I SAM-dependent methyltransferase n=1 Tax=Kribbella sp. NPDC003557 TaxID=3154449 RepID=UPI0033A72A92